MTYVMVVENMDEARRTEFDAALFADSTTKYGQESTKAEKLLFITKFGG